MSKSHPETSREHDPRVSALFPPGWTIPQAFGKGRPAAAHRTLAQVDSSWLQCRVRL